MILCHRPCQNKTEYGYCKTTYCIYPVYNCIPNTAVGYVPTKPKTNADRIRSMNNKELARVLEGTSYPWCNTPINCHHNNCYDCCEEWLKKEVKE